MDTQSIISIFIEKFIQKDKKKRVSFELTNPKKRHLFINRLNHNWEELLKPNCFVILDKEEDSPEQIQKILGVENDKLCYIISNYNEYDNKIIPYNEIFDNLYNRGLGSLIVPIDLNSFFLNSEQVNGKSVKCIGSCFIQNYQ